MSHTVLSPKQALKYRLFLGDDRNPWGEIIRDPNADHRAFVTVYADGILDFCADRARDIIVLGGHGLMEIGKDTITLVHRAIVSVTPNQPVRLIAEHGCLLTVVVIGFNR